MKTLPVSKKQLNWINIIFFSLLPVIALTGTVLLCTLKPICWATWILAGTYMTITGLSITAGYHRLFSHKSYQTVWPVRLVLLLFGAGAFQGSALEWCSDHRNHHRYTDTDSDPYSIKKGFWHAHIGWLFRLDTRAYDFANVEDLHADKLIAWQHKHYLKIAIFMGFLLPAGIATLWGDPLGGLIIAGALRMTLNHHFTFAINSIAHTFGKRTYSHEQSARDNWFTALVTYGEGFHNFHHQFPIDYRNGIRPYHFDPTKWLIKTLSWCQLASDLKSVSTHRIIRYRVQTEEFQLISRLTQAGANQLQVNPLQSMTKPILDNIYQALKRMDALEKEYLAVLKQKYDKHHPSKNAYYIQLKSYKAQFKATQQNLKNYLQAWKKALKAYNQLNTNLS